jgi:hypothetical protein
MASHAHHPSDPISATKIGGIAVALITTVGGIIVAVVNQIGSVDAKVDIPKETTASNGPTPTISAASTVTPLDAGLRFSPIINGKLTVSGSAQKDVNGMYVVIGPKPSGTYDTGCGNVVNQHWQAEVATDQSWQKYTLATVPAYGSCVGATSTSAYSASAYEFTFQGTEPTTPPPPPDQVLDCAKQHGPSCFNGPGFGPPTTYPSQ